MGGWETASLTKKVGSTLKLSRVLETSKLRNEQISYFSTLKTLQVSCNVDILVIFCLGKLNLGKKDEQHIFNGFLLQTWTLDT